MGSFYNTEAEFGLVWAGLGHNTFNFLRSQLCAEPYVHVVLVRCINRDSSLQDLYAVTLLATSLKFEIYEHSFNQFDMCTAMKRQSHILDCTKLHFSNILSNR